MPGKLCDGLPNDHYDINSSKAYCEGRSIAANSGSAGLPTGITGVEGDNNAISWTAIAAYVGQGITIILIDPAANDAELSVLVSGITIKVYLATGVAGAITSTAIEVYTAVNAATTIVDGTDEGTSDGSAAVVEESIVLSAGDNPHTADNSLAVDWQRGFTTWTEDPDTGGPDCCDIAFGGGFVEE